MQIAVAGGALSALPRAAHARDYASAAEVLDTIDGLALDVEAALLAIVRVVPAAQPFVASVGADHARQRRARDAIRARLHLPPAPARAAAAPASTALDALRATQQDLVHAHAEGMPAFHDPAAVNVLAGHMVDLVRHLTVIDLWIELEGERAG